MLLEIIKLPLCVLYLGCLVGMSEVKNKKQRVSLLISSIFTGVLLIL